MEFFESLFGINKSQKHEDFDKFIKTSFINYLNKSNLFKNFTKDFNNKNNELTYCKECNDLYIKSKKQQKRNILKCYNHFVYSKCSILFVYSLKHADKHGYPSNRSQQNNTCGHCFYS